MTCFSRAKTRSLRTAVSLSFFCISIFHSFSWCASETFWFSVVESVAPVSVLTLRKYSEPCNGKITLKERTAREVAWNQDDLLYRHKESDCRLLLLLPCHSA